MVKPTGAICNLDCKYCYYLEKEKLIGSVSDFRMSDETLEAFVRKYIEEQEAPEVTFGWQGGEPTLLGVGFFEKAIELQKRYANGKVIHNAFQTNGTLLDEKWGEFLAENRFLVGLSIDGPAEMHDAYRVTKGQRPTFERVIAGLDTLKRHKVEFNTLTTVHRRNADHPLKVYRFLKEIGSGFIQFIPIVERLPERRGDEHDLAGPPDRDAVDDLPVTKWSVRPKQYGDFLVKIFDEWVRSDVGRVFVQIFDVSLGIWMGQGASLCIFSKTCGTNLAVEHNGDVFSCDHFVYPKYRIGNVLNDSLGALVQTKGQVEFGQDKDALLPAYCRRCQVRFACNGECPKHRFLKTPDGEPGLNYLCAAYKHFFTHIDPAMRQMAALLRAGRAPAEIMSPRPA